VGNDLVLESGVTLPRKTLVAALSDVNVRPPATIIYVRPGFEREADVLAQDLQTPDAVITALPTTPVTANDELGDLVVVLGPDAQR
jgi:hypothetical protein